MIKVKGKTVNGKGQFPGYSKVKSDFQKFARQKNGRRGQ